MSGFASIYVRDASTDGLCPVRHLEGSLICTADAGLELVADARLDNRPELLASLGLPKPPPRISDSALILAAYERWGEDCPARLLGDFAFALWDGRRHRLFCARDHAGIKQIAYYCDSRIFACASSPERLLAIPGVPAEPDPPALAAHLLDRFPDPAATLYRGIRRIPAAHSLAVASDSVNLRRYWDAADAAPLAFRSADESIERFRDTFAAAVSCRLHGARPVSATLSGGLDSSAIVCMARQILPDSFARAYSLVFDELPCDERRYIDAVALASNVKVEYCVADEAILPLDPANPEPLSGVPCDATFAMNFGMLERARRQGVRTMLWGVGGDELLHSGDAYLSDFMRRRRFRALAGAVGDRLRYVGPADLGRCAVACARPLVPARAKTAVRRLHRPPRWIRQDFLREAGALDPSPAPQPRFGSEAQEGIYRSLSSGRTAAVGIPGLDALASAFSMEFRYPFLDRRLVEFVLGLPSDRAELFAGKLLLREAMPGILPELVRNRLDKTGFRPLVERSFDVQAGIIGSLIASSELAQVGAIERRPLEEMLAQQRHRGSERVTNAIASFLRSEMWLRGLRQRQRNRYAEPSGKQLECDEESLLGAAPGYIR